MHMVAEDWDVSAVALDARLLLLHGVAYRIAVIQDERHNP